MVTHAPYYITTAISYPNGAPHIGHAYELVAADAIARFQRLDGKDVFFLTGTDEHGLKMLQTAAQEGISPQSLADRNSARFREMGRSLNASNDAFIRTTEPRHHAASQAIWTRMREQGDIYLGKYSGWYSVRDEAYYAESETTPGPNGARLGPQGTPVEWTEAESYFFRLSAYQDRLLALYDAVPNFVGPNSRRNEVLSFVRGGLEDLAISRNTFEWGVKVPGDPRHVMYVWVDALTNYITAAGYPDESAPLWRHWPADVHIIGKDIVRFHTVYWPAFLISAGLPVPKRVFCHGFLTVRGEKMSKSVGNVVAPHTLVETFGVDQFRYFVLREVAFGQDGNYSDDIIFNRVNADLANDLGNLAQRSLSMINKNCDGVLPVPGTFTEADQALLESAGGLVGKARAAMGDFALQTILQDIFAVVAEANRYFAAQAPWVLRKTDVPRMETVLYVTAEVLRQIGLVTQPFMPGSSEKLLDLLGVPAGARDFAHGGAGHRLAGGTPLPAPAIIFPRIEMPKVETAPA